MATTPYTLIKNCFHNVIDQELTIKGWIKTRRDSKAGLSFLGVHDGSCFSPLQVIASSTLENYNEILKLTSGCAVEATGKIVVSQGKGQKVEMIAKVIKIVGWVEQPESYPIQAKRHSLEFLREVAHLRPRTNTISALTRVRHHLAHAIHQFFYERDFFWISTPIITASDCEGAGEMFRVSTLDLINLPRKDKQNIDFKQDFFGQETFLTVSGQLNVEAYCLAMSKVYTFGPTFRAENSNTSRHLAEFWMVEPEIAFADLHDICILSQELLRYICKQILLICAEDMQFFDKFIAPGSILRLENLITADFKIITYDEAVTALEKVKEPFTYPVQWGLDLQSEHERYLTEKLWQQPLIIINYPKDIKGFYMKLNEDHKTVAAMDLLVPGIGELIGGSQREERADILAQRMNECNLDQKHYQWYYDLRRYGTVPHAGFGLGFERLLSYITGLHNVRDVIPFPRTPGQINF